MRISDWSSDMCSSDLSLLISPYAPEQTKAYLRAVAAENDGFKFKEVRPFSATIARVAPQELADLVAASLIEPHARRSQGGRRRDKAFSFKDKIGRASWRERV